MDAIKDEGSTSNSIQLVLENSQLLAFIDEQAPEEAADLQGELDTENNVDAADKQVEAPLDVNNAIVLTTETKVTVNGKTCVLSMDEGGQLLAVPLKTPAKRPRGRPRKHPKTESELEETRAMATAPVEHDGMVAVEGLLGLSETDGTKKSTRRQRGRTNEDYDYEVSSDEEEDDVSHKSKAASTVKRKRGRPRICQQEQDNNYVSFSVEKQDGETVLVAVAPKNSQPTPLRRIEPATPGAPPSVIIENRDGSKTEVTHVDTTTQQNNSCFPAKREMTDQSLHLVIEESAAGAGVDAEEPASDMIYVTTPAKPLGMKVSETHLTDLKCRRCGYQAYYKQQFQEHLNAHADDLFRCKVCSFLAFTNEQLIAHFKTLHPKNYCDQCGHMVEHSYHMRRHAMRHEPGGWTCKLCNKSYKDQYILKMHVKNVHLPVEVLFECQVCMKKFTRKAHLKRHLRTHSTLKPFKCPHCDYRGTEKSDIAKHIAIHSEPRFVCEICNKPFRHLKNKDLHMKRHAGQRDYKCGVCDFFGYTFTDIRKHIERKHTNAPRKHMCSRCGVCFETLERLEAHKEGPPCTILVGGMNDDANTSSPASGRRQHVFVDGHGNEVKIMMEPTDELTANEANKALEEYENSLDGDRIIPVLASQT